MAMGIKRTHEEFVKEINDKFGDVYEFLTEYSGIDGHVKTRHKKCGYVWEPKCWYLLNPKNSNAEACPNCNRSPLSTDIFKEKVKEIVGNEYLVVGEYFNSSTYITIQHNTKYCNHEYQVKPMYFLKGGSKCPECKKRGSLLGKLELTKQFKKDVYAIEGDSYSVVGEFINNKTKIKIIHNECNTEFEVTPNGFLNKNSRCSNPRCSKVTNKYNFKDKVFEKYENEYLVLEEYLDSGTEIKFLHNVEHCGKEFLRVPKHFLFGRSLCPFCQRVSSKWENIIEKFLKNNNINFEREFTFADCREIYVLRFDFAIFDNNGTLKYLIEFDGRHHFSPVTFGGMSKEKAEVAHQITKKNDSTKNIYCKENNIILYRIPHWKSDEIESILNKLIIHNDIIKVDENYIIL